MIVTELRPPLYPHLLLCLLDCPARPYRQGFGFLVEHLSACLLCPPFAYFGMTLQYLLFVRGSQPHCDVADHPTHFALRFAPLFRYRDLGFFVSSYRIQISSTFQVRTPTMLLFTFPLPIRPSNSNQSSYLH